MIFKNLFMSVMATISVLTLVLYEFLCICRLIGKEEIVEKIWKCFLPKKEYNAIKVFVFIRIKILSISMLTFLLSGCIPAKLTVVQILLFTLPILSLLTSSKNMNKK